MNLREIAKDQKSLDSFDEHSLTQIKSQLTEATNPTLKITYCTAFKELFLPLQVYEGKLDSVLDKLHKNISMTFVSLPDNFDDFLRSYFYTPCDRCHKSNLIVVCLLCGDTMCAKSCISPNAGEEYTIGNHELTVVGNAAKHSFEYHNGTSVFLECNNGSLIMYENGRVSKSSKIFMDKKGNDSTQIGDKIRFEKLKNYLLNRDMLNEMLKLYINVKILHKIVHNVLVRNEVYSRLGY